VVIVESRAPAWETGGGWRLSETPILEIGALDGPAEYQFERIEGVLRLADGRIVVADGGASQIRFYDSTGRFLSASGRPGEAPGEYRYLVGIGAGPRDSLWAYDIGTRRFTVLAGDGRAVRTLSVGGSLSAALGVGRLPDGSFVVHELWSFGSHSGGPTKFGLSRDPAAVARLSSEGGHLDTIGVFAGREVYIGSEGGRTVMSAPFFARTTSVALRAGLLYVGDQRSFEIGVYSADGRLKRLIRVPDVDLRIRAADVERAKEEALALEPEGRRAMMRAHFDALALPATRAAFGDLLVDEAGNLWVAEAVRYPQDPRRWSVFDAAGALLGVVQLPERFRLSAVGADWALGVGRDELEVERVRLHRLEKWSASEPDVT
jgi:hypothetical protein